MKHLSIIFLLCFLRPAFSVAQISFELRGALTANTLKLSPPSPDYYETQVRKPGYAINSVLKYGKSPNFRLWLAVGFARRTTQVNVNGRAYESGRAEPVPVEKQVPFLYSANAITVTPGVELVLVRTANGEFTASGGLNFNNFINGQLQDAKPVELGTDPDGIATVTYERLLRPEKLAFGSAQLDDFSRKNTDLTLGIHYSRWNDDRSAALRFGMEYAMGISNAVNANNPDSKIFFGNPVKNRAVALSIGYVWVL